MITFTTINDEAMRLSHTFENRRIVMKTTYNSDKELLDALYSGKHLNEKDIKYLLWDLGYEVDFQEFDMGRWTQYVSSIIKLPDPNDLNTYTDDLWCIDWERGLTELQENAFYEQPYRVKCVEKTVVVKTYVRCDEQ